uniref:Zinc finger protein 786 n=1 Tax=Catagonus wagneri TaxID=51154 RepID=A0A8C3YH29_9CETA
LHFTEGTETGILTEFLFSILGSQQTMNSGDAHCHFQVDPLQSQCSSEPLLGKNEDVSFRLNQIVILLNPHRYDTRSPVPAIHSSRKPTERERLPSPGTLGLTGFQEISREGVQHPCPDCGESFWQKSLLELHQGGHSKDQPHKASKQFNKPADLEQPPSTSQGQRHFRCPECGRGFRRKQCLRSPPERTHSRERPFLCGECGKGFTRPSKLEEHLRVHSGERPFDCADCGRRFRLKGQLRSHQRLHTGERPFPCPDCGKSYRVKADMKAHRLLHGGQMPFSCECGKGFTKQSKLVEHIRTHTGEKPFQCPQCDKSFRLKAQLLSHQGLHTGERPFHCPECNKNFREKVSTRLFFLVWP